MESPRPPFRENFDYHEETYGEMWAPYYDEIFSLVEDSTIDLLRGYAGSSARGLELAVGTGRIAIPLAKSGVDVTGIDISQPMLDRLKAKDGGGAVTTLVGDIAGFKVADSFPLVYLPFNTLFALTTQEKQVACFRNAAQHLDPGGRFVLDCFVPDPKSFDRYNTRMAVSSFSSPTEHAYEMTINFPTEQRSVSQMVRRHADGSTVVLPVEVRYAWPAELDLMGRLAGLELEHRWGWYDQRAFTEQSGQHVSVYRKPGNRSGSP